MARLVHLHGLRLGLCLLIRGGIFRSFRSGFRRRAVSLSHGCVLGTGRRGFLSSAALRGSIRTTGLRSMLALGRDRGWWRCRFRLGHHALALLGKLGQLRLDGGNGKRGVHVLVEWLGVQRGLLGSDPGLNLLRGRGQVLLLLGSDVRETGGLVFSFPTLQIIR